MIYRDYEVKDTDVAVIGYACRFPKSNSPEAFWQNLKAGKDCITRKDQPDPRKTYAFGIMEDVYEFEPEAFGLSEIFAKLMDPQQRLMFKLCAEALETGGYLKRKKTVRVGLFCSLYEFVYVWKGYFTTSDDTAAEQTLRRTFLDGSSASRIAYHMNFTGPCMPLKASCASSLYAIHEAVNALINGECDIAIAGGANILENQEYYINAENTLSASGYTKAFGKDADGFVPGCGGGAVLLKPLNDSIRDADTIHAVIKGSAINNDGSEKASYAAPSIDGESKAIADALDIAEVDPEDIGYIEAHGTGTKLGDSVEIAALHRVFGKREQMPLYIGSVKSNIGHLNFAAGIAGFLKAVMMLEQNTIVPSLYSDSVNPELHLTEYGYHLADACMVPEKPLQYAGVSAFGVGGNNCHIVLSAFPTKANTVQQNETGCEIILSSAHRETLRKDCFELAAYLEHHPEVALQDIAYTLCNRNSMQQYRGAFGAKQVDSLIKMLKQPFVTVDEEKVPANRKNVWLFPGSNVIRIEDAAAIYHTCSAVKASFTEIFQIVKQECGYDLQEKLLTGEEISDPVEAAMLPLCVQYVIGELLRKNHVQCDAVLGYSAGEYTAAYFAGVISKTDLIRLYYLRNRLLEKLPEGKMASVLGNPEKFSLPEGVYVSARNAPNRFMITGLAEDIDQYLCELDEKQIFYSVLPLSRAGHCQLVDTILPEFQKLLDTISFHIPDITYISSAEGNVVSDVLTTPEYWMKQFKGTVRYYEAVRELDNFENVAAIEVGIGEQLSYFAKKSVKNRSGKLFISMIREDIGEKGEALLAGLSTLTSYKLKAPAVTSGRKVYLPPSTFLEKTYREYIEQEKTPSSVWQKQLVLDGDSDKMRELLLFLREKGDTAVLQYQPEETGWKSTEELYRVFHSIEEDRLKTSEIKCVKENKALKESLDLLCFAASAAYFRSYGIFLKAGESYTWGELKSRLHVTEAYIPFVMLLLSWLCDYGHVDLKERTHAQDLLDGDQISCTKSIADCMELSQALAVAAEKEERYIPFFERFAEIAKHYAEVFEGKTLGKEFLYPNGSYQQLFEMYQKIPEMNKVRLYATVFTEILENLAKNSKRPLKILEIGAGTGLVTWKAVKVIEKYGGDYWFTDIGASFIEKAKAVAKERGYHSMEFCKSDVTKNQWEQGIPENYFDIIISCNVIQATGDMQNSFCNCHRALRKGGFCVLLQTMDGHSVSEMFYGLTPEWWNYYHDPLRKYSPIMSKEHFETTLRNAGFCDVHFLEGNAELQTDAALIFAQKVTGNAEDKAEAVQKIDGYENRYVSAYISKSGEDYELVIPESWKKRYALSKPKTGAAAGTQSATEQQLCKIIKHITGIQVGDLDASIYSYDIDSLCGLMMCSQIKSEFQIEYSIKDLLSSTTVKEIADMIDQRIQKNAHVKTGGKEK